jgi:hypothetical protein
MAKDRLKALCLSVEHVVPFDIADPSALTAAIDAMKTSVGDSDSQSVFDNLNASMSTVRAHVTGAKSLDGEAQIVLARGKKRHIYDFNMTLDFEVSVEPASIPGGSSADGDSADDSSKKAKKYKGTLQFQEISPNCTIEPVVKFKKELPSAVEKRVKLATDGLKSKVCESIRAFELEFKDM